jgi:hypothetical protein
MASDALAQRLPVVRSIHGSTSTDRRARRRGEECEMILAAMVVLLVLAFGAIPAWPYSREWGYYPSSALTVALLIVLALVLTGRL